jgi:hypothetical protein
LYRYLRGSCKGSVSLAVTVFQSRGPQIFQTSRSHLKILGPRRVTRRKFCTEAPPYKISVPRAFPSATFKHVLYDAVTSSPTQCGVWTRHYCGGVHKSGRLNFVRWHLIFTAQLLQCPPIRTEMCISSHAPSRKRRITEVHRSLQTCGSSVWDLLHVTFWRLEFGR